MSSQTRMRQLSDRIRTLAAELIERRVKDPRLGFVTVTDARVTGDLREATVFYTAFGDEQARAASASALASATGMMRTEIGRRLGMRHTPSLAFVADAVPESASAVDELLRQARERDERVAAIAIGASYAGEADPYGPRPLEDDAEDEHGKGEESADEPDLESGVDRPE